MFMAYTTPNSTIPDWIADGYCQLSLHDEPPLHRDDRHAQNAYNASRSYHPGGVNALMGDGSVKFFKNSIAVTTWRALLTPIGGEVVSSDTY